MFGEAPTQENSQKVAAIERGKRFALWKSKERAKICFMVRARAENILQQILTGKGSFWSVEGACVCFCWGMCGDGGDARWTVVKL